MKSYLRSGLYLSIGISLFLTSIYACNSKDVSKLASHNQAPNDSLVIIKKESRLISKQDSVLVNKGFYLFHVLNNNENLRKIVRDNKAFKNISKQQTKKLKKALNQCPNVLCYASAIQWSHSEINTIGNHLTKLYRTNNSFKQIMSHLRDKGYYILYKNSADTTLLRKAWREAALGINHIIDIYLKGEKPIYPKIDSISFHVHSKKFERLVHDGLREIVYKYNDKPPPFFELPLQAALKALQINGREEATWYEPLKKGLNTLPFKQIDQTSWDAYSYSVILILGHGPGKRDIPISLLSKKHCQRALKLFKQKKAPFMVVSGGHAHPYKTDYCEAVQMKKYLVDSLGAPKDKIFIEPYARHTTTNIRNTSRMIYRFGMPANKPVLIVTHPKHNSYVSGKLIKKRALKQLGYIPYKNLRKLNKYETEFYPVKKVLQANPFCILDP